MKNTTQIDSTGLRKEQNHAHEKREGNLQKGKEIGHGKGTGGQEAEDIAKKAQETDEDRCNAVEPDR